MLTVLYTQYEHASLQLLNLKLPIYYVPLFLYSVVLTGKPLISLRTTGTSASIAQHSSLVSPVVNVVCDVIRSQSLFTVGDREHQYRTSAIYLHV